MREREKYRTIHTLRSSDAGVYIDIDIDIDKGKHLGDQKYFRFSFSELGEAIAQNSVPRTAQNSVPRTAQNPVLRTAQIMP